MNLETLSNDTLLDEVKSLVGQEKKIIARVIEYLKEIELRKLFLERGFSSMFAFATEYLGYSEAEAHIRLQAARLTQSIPEVSAKIESGELSLSVAAAAQAQFRKEDARRLSEDLKPMKREEKREVLEQLSNCSRREAEQKLSNHFAGPSDLKKFEFLGTTGLEEKLEHLFDYFAHLNFERDLGKLIDLMADRCMKEIEKKYEPRVSKSKLETQTKTKTKTQTKTETQTQTKTQTGTQTQTQTQTQTSPQNRKPSRKIPVAVQRLARKRADNQCAHVDHATGNRCSSRHALQFDHIIPFSNGGTSDAENITLLCAAHNRWKGNSLFTEKPERQ